MRLANTPERVFQFLKCLIVVLCFLVIVTIPFVSLANNPPDNSTSNMEQTVENVLSMLGGGGIGVAGSNFIQKARQQSQQQEDLPASSGFHINALSLQQKINQVERRFLKNEENLRSHQKKMQSKINAIEFFLGKKFEDFTRKDTEY